LLTELWTAYLAQIRSAIPANGVHPVMRRVSYLLENEAFPEQPLRRGIRMLSRSRRSCTFAAAVWHPDDGRMVHVGEMVTVFVDPSIAAAVEIPAELWAEVERFEGRSIPTGAGPASS
jgi:acyl-CoA thioesterase FadM